MTPRLDGTIATMEPAFVDWLEALRQDVAAARASAQEASSDGSKRERDKRLDHRLPMQFEHDGKLHWAERAHAVTFRSAMWQIGFYACWLVATIAVFVRHWMPEWLWLVLAAGFAVTWTMSRLYRRRERPAEQWRAEAEVVPGALVYANAVLFRAGTEPSSNAGFVFTFDLELQGDAARLKGLAERLAVLADGDGAIPAELRELRQRLRDWSMNRTEGSPHTFDRVAVPRSWSGNDETFVTMVAVDRRDLPDGVVERQIYPLLARRDRNESVDLLPLSFWHRQTT